MHPIGSFREQNPDRLRFRRSERRVGDDDDTHHPPHTARMTVIFVPACKRVVAAGNDLVVDRCGDSVGGDTLLHQQFGERRCSVGFDG